ncbi:MAG: oligosaccharyl transferase glycoprotein complex, beta subunit [Sclerophora amabilis]|nr:MAG: oligosaccharyl transferase glycoprotein complex, beta subunit [Sclerophora amabilis]
MLSLFYLLLLSLVGLVQALSTGGNRLLVVLEEVGEKSKYSKFWNDLETRGYKLIFESPKNEKLSLFEHGDRAFDHLILLPPKSKGLGPALTPALLLKFLNSEGNILLALSSTSPTPAAVSSLLLELDIQLPPEKTSLTVDHFNYDTLSSSEKHDVLVLPRPGALRPDVREFFHGDAKEDGAIAFPRAVGQVLGNTSPLLAPVLRAPSTAYAYDTKEDAETAEEPFATGEQLSLVSTLQARNAARFTVVGSVESLADEWFNGKIKKSAGVDKAGKGEKKQGTANQDFFKQLSAWTFKEIGILKVGKVEHSLSEDAGKRSGNNSALGAGDPNPKIYRVKNDVTFSIELMEYKYDSYHPFELPASDDLQLEFSMLSPFHRLSLRPSETTVNSTKYTTSFTLPDQHGIFNFRVNYKRPFLSTVDEKRTVTVRHFAHDEWPRSWRISGAWVWIGGIWVTVGGWLVFVALWLWSAPVKGISIKKSQ